MFDSSVIYDTATSGFTLNVVEVSATGYLTYQSSSLLHLSPPYPVIRIAAPPLTSAQADADRIHRSQKLIRTCSKMGEHFTLQDSDHKVTLSQDVSLEEAVQGAGKRPGPPVQEAEGRECAVDEVSGRDDAPRGAVKTL